ncbi:hypothetical protein Avbf_08551 [Armadillidium vulgare]|nr:hypothetical protein Avbf_08551 [Armadillidium vulgare]
MMIKHLSKRKKKKKKEIGLSILDTSHSRFLYLLSYICFNKKKLNSFGIAFKMSYPTTLSKEILEQAQRELNEDPKRVKEDIEHIRQWIKKQPHLHIRTDDFFILRFLRGCKFSLEKTKQKIDMHFTLKAMVPEWFKGRDPDDPVSREILKLGIMVPLKDLDNKNRRVFLMRNNYDPRLYDVNALNRAFYMLGDVFYEIDEIHQVTGVVMIMDLKESTTAAHFLLYPPAVMKKAMVLWQDGYCARYKGMYYIHMNSAFETIFKAFRVFLNEKIKSSRVSN